MAARRGKSQARRSGGNNNGLPGWAWLVIGVLLALVVVLMAPKFIGGKDGEGGFFRIGAPHANPDAQPQGSSETDGAFEPVGAEPAAKPAKQAENRLAHRVRQAAAHLFFHHVEAIAAIAAHVFVATVTRQGHGNVLARQLTDPVGRDR